MASPHPTEPANTPLAIDLIRADGGTQSRAILNEDTVKEYAEQWQRQVAFEPIVVFSDGETYWLADGFHRLEAAKRAKRSSISCLIHQGSQREAMLFSAGANAAHGLRRTNADKRHAAEMLLKDKEWSRWSDNKIAEHIGVSPGYVGDVRRQLSSDDSSPARAMSSEPRIGRDGKVRNLPSPKGQVSLQELLQTADAQETALEGADFKELHTDNVDATRKKFADAVTLFAKLTQCIDQCHRLSPNQLRAKVQARLNDAYDYLGLWKSEALKSG